MNLKLWHLGLFAATILFIIFLLMPSAKERGVLLARSGKVEDAEKKLLPLLLQNPHNIKIVEELAEGYTKAGESEKAVRLYEEYLKNNPDNEEVILKIAANYEANFKYRKAFELLERNKADNYDRLIELAVKMGELDKAVELSKEKLTAMDDKSARMTLLKDIEKYQQWQLNYKGVGEAREEIAAEDDNLQNNLDALDFFIWKKNKQKMKFYALKVDSYKGLSLETERELRSVWITLRDGKRALAAAEKVVAFNDADYQDWSDYLTLLGWTGENGKALAVAEKLIKMYPTEQELYLQGLALAAKLKDNTKRAEILEQYYNYNGDVDLLREAADLYLAMGSDDKAVALFDRIIKEKGQNFFRDLSVEGKIKLGEIFARTGRKEGNVLLSQALKSLLGKDLTGMTANDFWEGITYARKIRNKKLEARIDENFYRFDGNVQMLRDARDIYVELSDMQKAVKINEKLLAKAELSDFEEFGLLRQYAKLGEKEKAAQLAEKLYARILSGNIREDDPYWLAIDYAAETKNSLMRARIIDKFYQINKDPGLLREAAGIYITLGMDKAALADYDQLLAAGTLESFDKEELLRLNGKLKQEKELKDLALKFYNEAMARDSLDRDADLYYTLVSLLPALGYGNESVSLIKKYAQRGDIEARIQLAQYYRDSAKLAEAKKELELIIADKSTGKDFRDQAAVQLAYIYAEEFYQEGADQLRSFDEGGKYIEMGVSILEASLKNALPADVRGIEDSIDNFRLVMLRNALLRKEFEQAEKIIAQLYNPDSRVYLGIASAYFDSEQLEKAKFYLTRVDNTATFDVNEFSLLGYLYSSFEEYEKSLAAYQTAEKMSRGLDKNVMLGLAQVYGRTEQLEKQYQIVDFYTSFAQTSVDDWLAAANARAEHGNNKEEFIVLARSIEAHGNSAILLSRLISKLVGYGERERAVALAKKLRGLKVRKDYDELVTVGYALLDVGQIREAGRMFLAARAVDEKNPQSYLALARYYAAVYLYPQAQKAYMLYLKKNKNDATVWYELAVLKRAAGFRGGRYAFLKAQSILDQGEKNAAEFSLASSIAFYLDKRDDALRYGKYAADLNPESDEYKLDLAEMYNSFGYPEYALKNTAKVTDDDNLAPRRESLTAGAYMLSRKFRKGIDSLKQVIARRPADSAAEEATGYAELELGEWVEAADALKVAELKSNREEERLAENYQRRKAAMVLSNVELPDFEE